MNNFIIASDLSFISYDIKDKNILIFLLNCKRVYNLKISTIYMNGINVGYSVTYSKLKK